MNDVPSFSRDAKCAIPDAAFIFSASVNFVPEEGRWYCYAPTATGMQKIPVSMDSAPFDASFMTSMDEEAKEVVN